MIWIQEIRLDRLHCCVRKCKYRTHEWIYMPFEQHFVFFLGKVVQIEAYSNQWQNSTRSTTFSFIILHTSNVHTQFEIVKMLYVWFYILSINYTHCNFIQVHKKRRKKTIKRQSQSTAQKLMQFYVIDTHTMKTKRTTKKKTWLWWIA